MEFTDEQKQAIIHKGSLVITACPGSGKTAVIVQKIKNDLKQLKSYQGIIAITFTRKATEELEHRCRSNGTDIKSSFFGTIDSFCLAEFIYPFGSHLFGASDIVLEPKHDSGLSDIDRTILSSAVINAKSDISIELIKKLYKNGTIYFPSIAIMAIYIYENCIACRKYIKSKYICTYVDEYQDSSKAQHELFLNLVTSGITGVAVGDLQQSIYAWRNSSPEFLKNLMVSSQFSHRTVSYNHRCHASIVNYANRLFNKDFILLNNESIQVYHCNFVGTQRDTIVSLNKFIPLLFNNNESLKASDIAILVRNNRSIDYLRQHLSIPARIFSESPIDELQSQTGNFWSLILKYRFDQTLGSDFVLESIPNFNTFSKARLAIARKKIRDSRFLDPLLLEPYLNAISVTLLGHEPTENERAALKRVVYDSDAIKQYYPASTDEIQCMTIHKAKGLEFEIIIHLDLCEWIYPYQTVGKSFSDKIYPSWEQDLNLHYVAITRAKSLCLLVHHTLRINSQDQIKKGEPSIFLRLPGINGLYKTYSYTG
jgi:DNA helicase-2/ATP-dependent DNA helicase PcrA